MSIMEKLAFEETCWFIYSSEKKYGKFVTSGKFCQTQT